MSCPECGRPTVGAPFCGACGHRLADRPRHAMPGRTRPVGRRAGGRRRLRAVAALVVVAVAAVVANRPTGGDVSRDGVDLVAPSPRPSPPSMPSAEEEALLRRAEGPALGVVFAAERWSTQREAVWSPPVLAGGFVVAAGGDGRFAAFDVITGAVAWSSPEDGGRPVGVGAAADVVVGAWDDGRVRAVDGASGRTRWTTAFAATVPPVGIAGQVVLVGRSSAPGPESVPVATSVAADTGEAGALVALPAWVTQPGLVVASSLVLCGEDGLVTALAPVDLATRWSARLPAGARCAADPERGQVVWVSGGLVGAVDAVTGRERWVTALPSAGATGVAVGAPGAAVLTAAADVGVDLDTGEVRWTRPLDEQEVAIGRTPPAVAGGGAYYGPAMDGTSIVARYLGTGGLRWVSEPLGVEAAGPATAFGDLVVVPTLDGRLVAHAVWR